MDDPTRLLDQPDLPEREREVLEAGQRQPPVAYDAVQGAARLGRALNAPSGDIISTSSVAAKLGLKMLVSAVLCTIGFFASLEMTTPHETPTATSAPPIMAKMPQPAPPVVIDAPAPVTAVVANAPPSAPAPANATPRTQQREATRATAPEPHRATAREAESEAKPLAAYEVAKQEATLQPATAPTPQPQPQPQPTAVAPEQPPAPSSAMLEMKAIARAKRALSDDEPAQALSILAGVARDFPRGYLIEERRALHVLALAASGESDKARREATSFLSDYPSSAFTDRVKAAALDR